MNLFKPVWDTNTHKFSAICQWSNIKIQRFNKIFVNASWLFRPHFYICYKFHISKFYRVYVCVCGGRVLMSIGACPNISVQDNTVNYVGCFPFHCRPVFLPNPKDGSLYSFGVGGLRKLRYTIPELVSSSPYRSSDGALYTGNTYLFTIFASCYFAFDNRYCW